MRDLEELIERLRADGIEARACQPFDSVVLWNENGLTVRIEARPDERWVFAGAGMMVRLVADSDGEFSSLEELVRAILREDAFEYLRPAPDGMDVCGYSVPVGLVGEFAGGIVTPVRMRVRGWLARVE